MNIKLRISILVTIITVFMSCSSNLKVIQSEFDLLKFEEDNFGLDKLGNGKVLIYNGADVLHQATGRLNIWIDSQPLSQLKLKEYVIINLNEGSYKFKIQHIDVVNMRSNHNIKINKETKVIRVEPTVFSNKLTITNDLPKNSEKFKNILLR